MTVNELSREQMNELKQKLICERYDGEGASPSWGELADADDLVTDDEVYEAYCGVVFSEDDFWRC